MKKNTNRTFLASILIAAILGGCGAAPGADMAEGASYAKDEAAQANEGALEFRAEAPEAEVYYERDEADFDYAPQQSPSAESYLVIDENRAKSTAEDSLVTLSLKVDTAAYTNVARYLESGNLPPRDAVRTEELLNYFSYDGEMSFGDGPFAISTEVGPSPFDPGKHMAFIRVATEKVDRSELPRSNLTFLIDTSGSMDSHDKLPLLKDAFSMLTESLTEDDKVSIVTYAGNSAVVLDSVSGGDKDRIYSAIYNLSAGGSTAGAGGILTAYGLAEKNFIADGNNRVILATDGDFNVGVSSLDELADLVGEKRDNGVYLSVLGFGTGNIRDDIMETLSKNGNGNYSYINSVHTAKKVLVDELSANLFTVADDVKAQVEFNPATVKSYRLIGYENRMLDNRDFADDTKDAGEVGAGTDVVVMFELELQGGEGDVERKYTAPAAAEAPALGDELFEVRIRYKNPGESDSRLITRPVPVEEPGAASSDFLFACSVAAYGGLLRDSQMGGGDIGSIITLAEDSLGRDEGGYRKAHLNLLEQVRRLGR